ncbi:MAG TPA: alpha/beta hydrolase, partial [Caulobacteraceae bacterium]|nr:alpha/beta hydrolase [Caulobacteraceae bacterium]
MPTIESHDGTRLFCRRWGEGPPIVFLHGWAMSSEAWQVAMLQVAGAGFQAIAYDRRGHGRSDDPGCGYDYDSLADDLAAVMEEFELHDVILVGHSMGCGEITRYLSRYQGERVARAVMVAPFLPYPLKAADNPDGIADPASLQALRQMWVTNFAGWLDAAAPGAFTSGAAPALVAQTVRQMLQCSLQAAIACNVAGAEADMRAEVAGLETPLLVLQGDQDGSCPLELTGRKVAALAPDCRLKVYPGATHTLVVEQAAE